MTPNQFNIIPTSAEGVNAADPQRDRARLVAAARMLLDWFVESSLCNCAEDAPLIETAEDAPDDV